MIRCVSCGTVSAGGLRYCSACGGTLNPDLDEVYARAQGAALSERRSRLEKDLRFWLAVTGLFFVAALVFRCNNLVRNLPRCVETPAVEVPPPPFTAQELMEMPWILLPLPAEK